MGTWQARRGVKSNAGILAEGEIYYCTDTKELLIGDGTTSGETLSTIPVGSVQSYAGATAPTGWILATASTPESIGDTPSAATLKGSAYLALYTVLWDIAGTDDTYAHKISSAKGASAAADWDADKIITIDYRGGVLRAIGAGTGWAELTAANTLGRKQDDSLQGFQVGLTDAANYSFDGVATVFQAAAGRASSGTSDAITGQIRELPPNGAPRTAKETRMKNIGVNIIIKY